MDPPHRLFCEMTSMRDPHLLAVRQIRPDGNRFRVTMLYFMRPQKLERVFVTTFNQCTKTIQIHGCLHKNLLVAEIVKYAIREFADSVGSSQEIQPPGTAMFKLPNDATAEWERSDRRHV
jgi:hypothetical protein